MLLLQAQQFPSQYVMCFRAASLCLQRVFISERGLAVLTAALSNILIGVLELPRAHTDPFASVFAAANTGDLALSWKETPHNTLKAQVSPALWIWALTDHPAVPI